MTFDEQHLRERLAAAAAQAGPPRFTVEGLTGRIRRRRARIIGLVSGSVLAVAAVAVAVPVSLSGQGTPSEAVPSKLPFHPSFTVRVNGQPAEHPQARPIPRFAVTPGRHLRISVGVTVPAQHRVTALWIGVSRGVVGTPGDLRPILAHTRKPLTPGLHTFRLRWTVPAEFPRGTTRYLAANWEAKQVTAAQFIAELVRPPGRSAKLLSSADAGPGGKAASLSCRRALSTSPCMRREN